MKQLILVFFIAVLFFNCNAQKIAGGEYFIDTYVKQGSGTSFKFSNPSSDTSITFQVDVSSLEKGIHTLYVRTLNDSAQWSHTSKRLFYITENDSLFNLTGYEYSIDTYIKQGSRNRFTFSSPIRDTSLAFQVDVSSFGSGLHTLYARTLNEEEQWSHTSKRLFYIAEKDTLYTLSGYEYSIDTYVKQGSGTFVSADTGMSFEIDCSSLEAGLHTIYMRTKNSSGVWSQTSKRVFLIPNEYEISNIVSLEYYYKSQEFVTDTFQYDEFTPSTNIEIDDAVFMANTAGLEYNKTYTLYVRAICDNGDISTFYHTSFDYVELTNTIDNELVDKIGVYPNPSYGLISLNIDSKEIGNYYIFDTNGKLIKTGTDLNTRIDLTNYPSGTYVIKVRLEDKLYSTKLIIK